MRRSVSAAQGARGIHHPFYLTMLQGLVTLLYETGKIREASRLTEGAQEAIKAIDVKQFPGLMSNWLNAQAGLLHLQGKYAYAENLFHRALELDRAAKGEKQICDWTLLNNLSQTLLAEGKYSESEALLRQAIGTCSNKQSPGYPILLNSLALTLDAQGKYEEAEDSVFEAIKAAQEIWPQTSHPIYLTLINNMSAIILNKGIYGKAEEMLSSLDLLYKKYHKTQTRDYTDILNNLGAALASQGKYKKAEIYYRKALKLRQEILGLKHPDYAQSLDSLCRVLLNEGSPMAAQPFCQQALALRKLPLGQDHPKYSHSLNSLAEVLLAQGKFEPALQLLTQALPLDSRQVQMMVSETRMASFLETYEYPRKLLYGLALSQPTSRTIRRLALTSVLLYKGRTIEAGAFANLVAQKSLGDPLQKQRFAFWQDVRDQYLTLVMRGPGSLAPSEYQERLRQLQLKRDELEYLLVHQIPELKSLQPLPADKLLPAVAKRLPEDGVLIELLQTAPVDFKADEQKKFGTTLHYLALLLFRGERMAVVDLGESPATESAIAEFLDAMRHESLEPTKPAQKLYQRVFAPDRKSVV